MATYYEVRGYPNTQQALFRRTIPAIPLRTPGKILLPSAKVHSEDKPDQDDKIFIRIGGFMFLCVVQG